MTGARSITNGRTSSSCASSSLSYAHGSNSAPSVKAPPGTWISSGPAGARSGFDDDGTGYERPERSCSASSIASCEESSFCTTSPNANPRRTSALGLSRSTCSRRSSARSRTSVAYARTGSARRVGRREPFLRARRIASYTSRCTSRIGGAPPRYRSIQSSSKYAMCARLQTRGGASGEICAASSSSEIGSSTNSVSARARSMSCRISTRVDTTRTFADGAAVGHRQKGDACASVGASPRREELEDERDGERRRRRCARRDAPLRRRRHRGRRAARRVGRHRAGQGDSGHGAVGLRQVDVDAHSRRPRQADVGIGRHRRHGDHDARRQRPHEAPARAHRLRLPVLQPAPHARREGEHPPTAHDRR